MKEISNEVWLKLWVKYIPRFKYFTTEDWMIYSYTKKTGYRKLNPLYDQYKLYNVISIWGKKMLFHRVILMNYIEQPKNKPHCNHINWDKTDNRLENLERCDRSYNITEAQRLWLKPTTKLYQFTKSWELVKVWNSIKEATRQYWACIANTVRCWPRESGEKRYKTSKWYIWSTDPVFPSSLVND